MTADSVVILSCARTPIGAYKGALASIKSAALGSAAVSSALDRSGVDPERIQLVYMGCVLAAGLGQAPARQAALGAGLPVSVTAVTVNRMCGSGMQAAMMAADALVAGSADTAIAGGMESMSGAPYLLGKHRTGAPLGHDVIKDSMYLDGLEDAYAPGMLMGVIAEDAAREYGFSREQQDDYAVTSLSRAQVAIKSGAFTSEVEPFVVTSRGMSVTVAEDEQPGKAKLDRIPTLKPAFDPLGRSPPRMRPRYQMERLRSC